MSKKDTNPKDAVGTQKWRQYSAVPITTIWELGVAMLEGARKYGRHNYRVSGVRASVYVDAAKGHIDQWWEGEDIDADSGLSHIVKAMASLAVLRDSMIQDMMTDDRPPKAMIDKVRDEMQAAVDGIFERFPVAEEAWTQVRLDEAEAVFNARVADVEKNWIVESTPSGRHPPLWPETEFKKADRAPLKFLELPERSPLFDADYAAIEKRVLGHLAAGIELEIPATVPPYLADEIDALTDTGGQDPEDLTLTFTSHRSGKTEAARIALEEAEEPVAEKPREYDPTHYTTFIGALIRGDVLDMTSTEKNQFMVAKRSADAIHGMPHKLKTDQRRRDHWVALTAQLSIRGISKSWKNWLKAELEKTK